MSLGQFGLLYSAMASGMPAGLAGLVLQAQVVLTILIAAARCCASGRPAPQVIGVGLGAVGLLVVGLGRGGHVPLLALALCLLAALSWAIGNVVVARVRRDRADSRSRCGRRSSYRCRSRCSRSPSTAPGRSPPRPARSDGSALVSTALHRGARVAGGLRHLQRAAVAQPSAAVVPWILLVPPVAIGSAWVLLGEQPTVAELVGGGILVAGVLVALTQPRTQSAVRVDEGRLEELAA